MKGEKKGIVLMLCCAGLWSIGGIFIKLLPWNPFVIAGWRGLIAAVVVAAFMKLTGRKFFLNRQVLLTGVIESLLFISFVGANKLTTAANAIVLQYTAPIFLLVFSVIFLKKSFHRRDKLAAFFTLLGVALCFVAQMEGGHLLGNFVAIASGALMGGMFLLMGEADPATRMNGMLLGHVFSALAGIPFSFFTAPAVDGKALAAILILGVFQLGVPYLLYMKASDTCPAFACCLLSALEPLLNPIWVALFDGETPGTLAVIGGLLVILTVTAWCVADAKAAEEK